MPSFEKAVLQQLPAMIRIIAMLAGSLLEKTAEGKRK